MMRERFPLSNQQRNQTEKYKKEQNKLSEQLSSEKVERKTLTELRCELDDVQEQLEQQEKTITALKMACSVSDILYFVWMRIIRYPVLLW